MRLTELGDLFQKPSGLLVAGSLVKWLSLVYPDLSVDCSQGLVESGDGKRRTDDCPPFWCASTPKLCV